MATPAEQEAPVFVEGAEVPLGYADAASLLFKDRSGAKLGGGPSEGSVNFGAVTAGAIQSVKDAQSRETSATEGKNP